MYWVYRYSSHREVNHLPPNFKNQSFGAVLRQSSCLSSDPYKTRKCTLFGKKVESLNVNLLKPTEHVMHQHSTIVRSSHTVFMYLYLSENTQQLVSLIS